MREHFWLTEAQMERLRPFFPISRGKPRVDDWRVLKGDTFGIGRRFLIQHRPILTQVCRAVIRRQDRRVRSKAPLPAPS